MFIWGIDWAERIRSGRLLASSRASGASPPCWIEWKDSEPVIMQNQYTEPQMWSGETSSKTQIEWVRDGKKIQKDKLPMILKHTCFGHAIHFSAQRNWFDWSWQAPDGVEVSCVQVVHPVTHEFSSWAAVQRSVVADAGSSQQGISWRGSDSSFGRLLLGFPQHMLDIHITHHVTCFGDLLLNALKIGDFAEWIFHTRVNIQFENLALSANKLSRKWGKLNLSSNDTFDWQSCNLALLNFK